MARTTATTAWRAMSHARTVLDCRSRVDATGLSVQIRIFASIRKIFAMDTMIVATMVLSFFTLQLLKTEYEFGTFRLLKALTKQT